MQDPTTSVLRLSPRPEYLDQICTDERPGKSVISAPTITWGDGLFAPQDLRTSKKPRQVRDASKFLL